MEVPPEWRLSVGQVLGVGLLLTVLQTLAVASLSGHRDPAAAYLKLGVWDSMHYLGIAEHGYHHDPAQPRADAATNNVGFFPGYPLTARLLALALGLPRPVALLVTAQLACWAFWAYVLLLLRRARASRRLTLVVILALVC